MKLPDFSYEKEYWGQGYKVIAGLDEVGRGAFAGPVVAGCVVFAPNYKLQITNSELKIDDSKKLSSIQREESSVWIRENCLAFGIGKASVTQINKLGIKKATEIAFRRAISEANEILRYQDIKLQSSNTTEKAHNHLISQYLNIEYLLVDAFNIPRVRNLPRNKQKPIIKGDSLSISIAAASIVAKVYRDKIMTNLANRSKFKKYQWAANKGYGTKKHIESIRNYGISNHHRKQFVKTAFSKI